MQTSDTVSIAVLRRLWLGAVACAGLAFAGFMIWLQSSDGPGLDWIWLVAAFGFTVVIYNAIFFLLCTAFVPTLASLVEDETRVEGDNVVHVVRHAETGQKDMDGYVQLYASARAITAAAIVSVGIATIALIFF